MTYRTAFPLPGKGRKVFLVRLSARCRFFKESDKALMLTPKLRLCSYVGVLANLCSSFMCNDGTLFSGNVARSLAGLSR